VQDIINAAAHLQACIDDAPSVEDYRRPDGGTAWDSYLDACKHRRQCIIEARVYLLRVQGIASADGAFEGFEAPHGIGEPIEARPCIASRDNGYGVVPMAVRRIERDARRKGTRRAVLTAARRAEASRRAMREALRRAALPTVEWCPAVPSSATRPLTAWDAIEERHADIERTRRASAALMASRPNRDGRGTVDAAPSSVNGTEVRNARRWQGSTRSTYRTRIENADGTTSLVPVDWQCYTVNADGTRVPFKQSTKASSTKRRTNPRKGSSVAKLNALAGVLGVEAQG